ncbi:hypothetical protein IFVP22_C220387 [Vibrio parahaemolyticus]
MQSNPPHSLLLQVSACGYMIECHHERNQEQLGLGLNKIQVSYILSLENVSILKQKASNCWLSY